MRLVILFVLTSSPRLLCDVVTTDAPTDLVDKLKQSLRKNNDDYIEPAVSIKVPNPYLVDATEPAPTTESAPSNDTKSNQTLSAQGTFRYGRGPPKQNNLFIDTKNNVPANRRKFDSFESDAIKHLTNQPNVIPLKTTLKVTKTLPRNTTTKVLNILRLNNSGLTGAPNFRSSFKKEHDVLDKMQKIKNFISKNKQIFEEFILKKRMESQAGAGNDLQLRASRPQNEVHLAQRARLRARETTTTMKPELLDMAPARGGQIHSLRVRGHLCHRHVLIPEGPKYDSRGKQYLDPYGHADGRNYSRTRPPHFVLPRCCNCCRKSVLGCE